MVENIDGGIRVGRQYEKDLINWRIEEEQNKVVLVLLSSTAENFPGLMEDSKL